MFYTIKCYTANKLVYTFRAALRKSVLAEQLKNRMIFYDTTKGGVEVIYLDHFDKVTIDTTLYHELLVGDSDDE